MQFSVRKPMPDDAKISYSQFAMYSTCPKHWELAYVKGLRSHTPSIHTVFGTAFHETLQTYLHTMYSESGKAADQLDLKKMLHENMMNTYSDSYTKLGEHFTTKFELGEFYNDGLAILEFFQKKRGAYFSLRGYELLGIELPIYHEVTDKNKNVKMLGYIDVVLRCTRTNRIIIYDIKTSTMGWNKYQKADKVKTSQLVLYKEYFARQFECDVEDIDICYFIVKRKLIEGAMFPQKRIQEFVPSSGKPTRNKLIRDLESFVSTAFDSDGRYVERNYPAVAGKANKNCKYCEFKNQFDLCPKENRIKE